MNKYMLLTVAVLLAVFVGLTGAHMARNWVDGHNGNGHSINLLIDKLK